MTDAMMDHPPLRETTQGRWQHPFTLPENQPLLRTHLSPALVEKLLQSVAHPPDVTPSTTDRQAVHDRLAKATFEDPSSFALRVLYEESFAVKPATPGGLVSHYYKDAIHIDDYHIQLDDVIAKFRAVTLDGDDDIFSLPFDQAFCAVLKQEPSIGQARALAQAFVKFGATHSEMLRPFTHIDTPNWHKILTEPEKIITERSEYGTYLKTGWKFFQVYQESADQWRSPLTDTELIQEFGLQAGISRIAAYQRIWNNLGGEKSQVLNTDDSTFKNEAHPDYEAGLRKLALLRSSPDFAFIYTATT